MNVRTELRGSTVVKKEIAPAIIGALVPPVFPTVILPKRNFFWEIVQQNHQLSILHSTANLAVLFLFNMTIFLKFIFLTCNTHLGNVLWNKQKFLK